MESRTVAVLILVLALGAFGLAYFVVGPGKRRGPKPIGDIPLAMRPYHADEELEKAGLERAMSWGVALTMFMAVFLPVYWMLEPERITDEREKFLERNVALGETEFASACISCHGADAGGGTAPHPDPNIDAPWPAPALNNIVARYTGDPNVVDIRAFMIQTIKQGRPGTPMPTWGAFYGGGMNDQQIEAIVDYLYSIQVDAVPEPEAFRGASGADVFQANCARCHGQDASGAVGPSLLDVFGRFGDDGTPEGRAAAIAAVRFTIENGRIVPTGAPMPAWKDRLTSDAIDRVIEYLTSIQSGA